MKSIKMRGICAAVTGALLFGFGANAMADSTTDIVNALVAKGVLTEEEGALLNKGREGEAAGQAKAMKKASKLSVSDAIDNAKIYGDIRARYERRNIDRVDTAGTIPAGTNYESNRSRYKITGGVETKAGDWYTDLAVAMSSNGRSDNVTFGDGGLTTSSTGGDAGMSPKDKSALYVKRAMIGWNVTPWLSVEAGRMKNPLYMVNSMVFDHDIVMEGAQEKLNYKIGETNLFANLGQWVYTGAIAANDVQGTTTRQNMILAFQAGAEQAFIADKLSAKGAVGYFNYTGHNSGNSAPFKPLLGTTTSAGPTTGYTTTGASYVNDLAILDVLGEANYMATSNIGIRPYAEYAYNTLGSDRYNATCKAYGSSYCKGNDDSAWLVGISVGSAKDLKSFASKKMAKNDWNLNLWYQSVGTYALDPNAVDTDIFDGRINMEGTTIKAQYNVEDNVALNFTGAWGDRKNEAYGSTYSKADIAINGGQYELFQFDVTYKF
jgi:hypothetical protein